MSESEYERLKRLATSMYQLRVEGADLVLAAVGDIARFRGALQQIAIETQGSSLSDRIVEVLLK